ncbi:pentatricopeptide repeat-containing protein At2g22410, mitochondrial-like [Cucurbita pepo subsp. pepo]|uniref:pentatricopeptide repeat-containing protein At2g22410, mitochondrial-like n=1 Tax=Cucurbita pepo subsp. pepo TaxID=3664 RepID=UPI000C9D6852|nr:pentatricopeptide repeat-containing protein At2g22410, mitochondrial-like [Cucurbita pepo subsp. pepo]
MCSYASEFILKGNQNVCFYHSNSTNQMLLELFSSMFFSRLSRSVFRFHSLPAIPASKSGDFKSPVHQSLHLSLERCSSMRLLKVLHAQIILQGLVSETLTLGKLVSFCAVSQAGDLHYAQLVFDHHLQPNKFMFNCLIRGYSTSQHPINAIFLYFKMMRSGFLPNQFTLPFVLKACASQLAYWEVLLVHCHAIRLGILSHVCVQNALINVYAVCGFVQCARQLFDEMSHRTLVSWNSIIGGYSRNGFCKEAFLLYRDMRVWGFQPDLFTLVHLFSICTRSHNLDMGKCVHLYVEITGIEFDQILRNALLDMYAKCGDLLSARTIYDRMIDKNVVSHTSMISAYSKHGLFRYAREVFDQIPDKNVISWNSMISCYVQEGRCKEALLLLQQMCETTIMPDEATLVSVLSACSQIGDLAMGKKAHYYICSNNIMITATLSNSLIDMYAKCGALETAMDFFFESKDKNLVSWNVIIQALALHGYGLHALKLFNMMHTSGIWPDEITFTGLLSACSHSGLVDMGRSLFERMSSVYGILPEIEHYACMVDLLGRGGLLQEAVKLIGGMPMKPDVVVWGAMLGACRIYGNVDIGNQILKQVLELETYSSGLYVLLSNIYFEAKRWKEVRNIRKLMNEHGIIKCKAVSFIEIDECITEFMVDDKRHETSGIYPLLDQLTDHLRSVGHLSNNSILISDSEG